MSKKEVTITDIIDEVVSYTNPSKEDLEKQIEQDKLNYLVWQCGVAIKELQEAVDKLAVQDQEASWVKYVHMTSFVLNFIKIY